MPGTQTGAIPITVRRLLNVNAVTPPSDRFLEDVTQTFKRGVPVALVLGLLQEAGTINGVAVTFVGFSDEFGHNLTVAGTAKDLTYGNVQNQPSAVLIPVGAPLSDGRCQVNIASDLVIFQGKTDDAHALAVSDIGKIFGLTKDTASGQWFVDTTITAAASGACVEVMTIIDPVGTVGGRVSFRVTQAYQQLFT